MNDDTNDKPLDEAAAEELRGVPEDMLDDDPSEADSASDAEAEIARLREENAAAKQEVLYAQAETQNVRRRLEKDIQDARAYSVSGFARDVLSISDNLDRAIDAVPEALREDEKFKGLVTGIEATRRELERVFAANGITRVAAMGMPLDPNEHQAMIEIPTADAEPGTVVQEMQAGYRIKDRLLRPAMVGVAKKPE